MVWKSYSLTCISIFKIAKKRVLARRCFEDDLYVLHTSHEALVASTHCNKASYEAWLSRLEHFSFDTIVTLQKLGNVSLTTILSFIGFILYTPSLSFIMPCQLLRNLCKHNSHTKLRFFKVMGELNLSITFRNYLNKMAPFIYCRSHLHYNKMEGRNANIDTLQKLVWPFYLIHDYHLHIWFMPSRPLSILINRFPTKLLNGKCPFQILYS